MSEVLSDFVSKIRDMIRKDNFETFSEILTTGIYNETQAKSSITYNRTCIMQQNNGHEILMDTFAVESVMDKFGVLSTCDNPVHDILSIIIYKNVSLLPT